MERARPADLEAVVRLLDEAALWQQSRGIDLWHPGTFEVDARATIDAGDLYVAREDDSIVGCFMLDDGSTRLVRWLSERGRQPDRGVVGRLTVARHATGRGLGLELLDAAGRRAYSEGATFLRLECPSDNGGLRRYYEGAGFTYCGDNDEPGPNGEPWVSSVFERRTTSPE